ncbi:uncharacterized protein cubi_00925 [Cryptosporidium ubiquitum]|uniref:Uncharacterized protein n=1 Tax=Cryptosporidium ubiquitum TaxID=857276 RepID=A0A1J4MCP2_9CRYT|nr:uncharacterized protein cubi_00925 [Cryptosporidium ubiquitum]OII70780.1 hypothetical protein cubi_00925 [Cryptosporidium ubiquitum]
MIFYFFVECLYILVIFKVNNVISLRNNKISSIENPVSILSELGEYSVNLKITELQKKINFCSSLLLQANNELVSARLKLAKKKSNSCDDNNTQEELVDELSKRVQEIGFACNDFLDLLLLKRIYCFNKMTLEDEIRTEIKVKEKIDNIVSNMIIKEDNAPFIRSLIYKAKCHVFQANEHCKLLTSKLLFYMAVTPKETVENFENFKLVDREVSTK